MLSYKKARALGCLALLECVYVQLYGVMVLCNRVSNSAAEVNHSEVIASLFTVQIHPGIHVLHERTPLCH